MVDPSEKLSNNHAHDTQACCFSNKMTQFFKHGLQPPAIGQLQSFSDMLVKRFTQGPLLQPSVSPSSAVLQSADEMKMAKLHNPALARTELDNSRNLVGDRSPDASVYVCGDRCEYLGPALHIFSARQEHRVEEDGAILIAGLDRHHIQDPIFSSKAEIKPVQHQDQGTPGQAQTPRSRYELSQRSTKTAAETLRSKSVAWSESFQRAAIEQYCFENPRRRSPRLAATPLLADSPGTFALTALTTSRAEVINFGLATRRFRMPRMHARELHTDYRSKYPKSQLNSV